MLYTTFDFGTGTSYSLNEIAKGFGEDYPIEYIEERKGVNTIFLECLD